MKGLTGDYVQNGPSFKILNPLSYRRPPETEGQRAQTAERSSDGSREKQTRKLSFRCLNVESNSGEVGGGGQVAAPRGDPVRRVFPVAPDSSVRIASTLRHRGTRG